MPAVEQPSLEKLRDHYDAVVIGAGIAGLTCANYLAKAGLSVLLLEKHHVAGGYCSSFKRKGFYFDAGAHYLSSCREDGAVGRLLRDLDLGDELEIRRFNPSDVIITPDKGTVQIRTNLKELIDEFQDKFPDESSKVEEFFKFIAETPPLVLYSRLKAKTFAELMDEFFNDVKLKNTLSILFGNIGLPPSKVAALSGVFLYREFVLDGGYYPKGGMQAFCDALVGCFKKHGGAIAFLTPVVKIVTQSKRVNGIVIKGGHFIGARYVISACDLYQTFTKLVSGDDIDAARFQTALRNLKPSVSSFMVYLGTKESIKHTLTHAACTWYYSDYDVDDCLLDWFEGRPNYDRGELCASFPSLHDSSLAPPGKDSIQLIACAPIMDREFWNRNSEEIAEKLIKTAGNFIPNLSAKIEIKLIATPFTLIKYTGNYQGAMYGWASTPNQVGVGTIFEGNPLEGLFLTGHWAISRTLMGQGGIPMVVHSGRTVAQRILREIRRNSSRRASSLYTKEHR